ncbi:helix-turn-helix domain-containing protein [Planctomycetes bacterium TBK1r]|uniref:Helix-turn-helix domain protein n=1 Tax=Stieleria magnilauensis TaxID=2527963 RepID=A0ABX5XZD7_9BACT|nr:Helix-turn-helix domain protein [Planctomycetes bacterium TBK1r]
MTTTLPIEKNAAMLTVADLAERWKCSQQHARHMVDSGRAPSGVKLGRLRRFPLGEIERWESDGCPDLRAQAS